MTDNTPDPQIEAAREAFIAAFVPEPGEESATEDPGQAVEAAAPEVIASEAGAETAAAEQPPVAEQTEPESRGYRRLLAREAKLREDAKALEADRAAIAEFRRARDKATADPVGFLRTLGFDNKQILDVLAEAHQTDLGDLAPPDVRANLAAKRAERTIAEAEERIRLQYEAANKSNAEREAQQFIAQYQAGIGEFVTTGLTEFPELAAVAAAGKPVAQAMYATAVEMASANPTGPAPTYAQVAAQLNMQLAELASVVAKPSTPTAPTAPAAPNAPAGKPVLRNSATSTQPGPAPEPANETYEQLRERIRKQAFARHAIESR